MYEKRLIVEIGSHGFGGWEIPQSSICQLENSDSWWYYLLWVQSPQNSGKPGLTPSHRSKIWEMRGHWYKLRSLERPRTDTSTLEDKGRGRDLPVQEGKENSCSFSSGALNKLNDATHIDEGKSSWLNLLIKMLICSRNTLTDTPWNKCFTSYLPIP